MDETTIIIMQKNAETGFLEKEQGSYTVQGDSAFIQRVYAQDSENGQDVWMYLTCEKELEDWEYEAVFDYYDTESLAAQVESVEEIEEHMNPVWLVRFAYIAHQEEMEGKLSCILDLHIKELHSVYDAIADKKDDYIES